MMTRIIRTFIRRLILTEFTLESLRTGAGVAVNVTYAGAGVQARNDGTIISGVASRLAGGASEPKWTCAGEAVQQVSA